MGTRARVEVYDGNQCLVSIYRHWDGYPSGLGLELADFLSGSKLVNGISDYGKPQFNGIQDLAAQLVWSLKRNEKAPGTPQIGNVYLYPPMTEDGEAGEEYVYRITSRPAEKPKKGEPAEVVHVSVTGGDITAFGSPNDPSSFRGLFTGDVVTYKAWLLAAGAAEG